MYIIPIQLYIICTLIPVHFTFKGSDVVDYVSFIQRFNDNDILLLIQQQTNIECTFQCPEKLLLRAFNWKVVNLDKHRVFVNFLFQRQEELDGKCFTSFLVCMKSLSLNLRRFFNLIITAQFSSNFVKNGTHCL